MKPPGLRFRPGFQVVAEEVAQLSDRSSQAAHQVREAIDEVESLVERIPGCLERGQLFLGS